MNGEFGFIAVFSGWSDLIVHRRSSLWLLLEVEFGGSELARALRDYAGVTRKSACKHAAYHAIWGNLKAFSIT